MLASFGRFRAAALPLGFTRVMLVGFAAARWRTLAAAVGICRRLLDLQRRLGVLVQGARAALADMRATLST